MDLALFQFTLWALHPAWVISSQASWAMFALGVALLITILFRKSTRYYKRIRKKAASAKPLQQPPRSNSPLVGAPQDTLQWQVEMHELGRDLKGEIDAKMLALQVLIRDANQQSERLERAIAEARKAQSAPNRGDPPT